ncbi:MAG: hypothetical protein F6K45_20625 [Kamptonema sp. SIO1D9]|nr:hypothetical protein [Kamptonema sp. SIO1D9]
MAKLEDLDTKSKREILCQGMAFSIACQLLGDEKEYQKLKLIIPSPDHWALTVTANALHEISYLSDEQVEAKFNELILQRGSTTMGRVSIDD